MTTTDTPDEIALPAFEDALWAALRAAHAEGAGGARPPSPADDVAVLDPVVVPVDASRRRHRALRRVLAAAAVAVLAGIGIVVATTGDDGDPTVAGPSTETTGGTTTTVPETVELRAHAAIAAVAGSSVVLTESWRDGVLLQREWVDGMTWDQRVEWYDAAGRPTAGQGPQILPTVERQVPTWAVNHCTREFISFGPWGSSSVLDWLASDLAGGAEVVDGTEVIDGRELIRVRGWVDGEAPPRDPVTGRIEQRPRPDQLEQGTAHYLDPETLLPVAVRSDIGTPDETLGTISILPRDEAAGELVAVVPEGYTEVQEGAWSVPDVGSAGC